MRAVVLFTMMELCAACAPPPAVDLNHGIDCCGDHRRRFGDDAGVAIRVAAALGHLAGALGDTAVVIGLVQG